MARQESQERKESFISQEDRPDVKLDPNMPVSELRVRDLSAIISSRILKLYRKELIKDKPEFKEFKFEKYEKYEKIEVDPLQKEFDIDDIFGPSPQPWSQIAEVVKGLSERVNQLADQVAELQQKLQG